MQVILLPWIVLRLTERREGCKEIWESIERVSFEKVGETDRTSKREANGAKVTIESQVPNRSGKVRSVKRCGVSHEHGWLQGRLTLARHSLEPLPIERASHRSDVIPSAGVLLPTLCTGS